MELLAAFFFITWLAHSGLPALELAIEILSTEYPRLNAMWEQLKAEQSLYWQVRIPACPTHSSLELRALVVSMVSNMYIYRSICLATTGGTTVGTIKWADTALRKVDQSWDTRAACYRCKEAGNWIDLLLQRYGLHQSTTFRSVHAGCRCHDSCTNVTTQWILRFMDEFRGALYSVTTKIIVTLFKR
jgi:hypothetical protein